MSKGRCPAKGYTGPSRSIILREEILLFENHVLWIPRSLLPVLREESFQISRGTDVRESPEQEKLSQVALWGIQEKKEGGFARAGGADSRDSSDTLRHWAVGIV